VGEGVAVGVAAGTGASVGVGVAVGVGVGDGLGISVGVGVGANATAALRVRVGTPAFTVAVGVFELPDAASLPGVPLTRATSAAVTAARITTAPAKPTMRKTRDRLRLGSRGGWEERG